MARDNDDTSENTIERSHRFDGNSPGNGSRQEPSFSNFDDIHEDGYEEPDRDTDFASGYRADSVEDEEELDDTFSDDEERDPFPDDSPDARYDSDRTPADESDNWLEQEADLEDDDDDSQTWPLGLIAVAVVAVVLLAAGVYGVMQQRAATQEELRELRAALAVSAKPEDVGTSRGALDTLQKSYDQLSAQAQALTLENRRLTDTVAGLEAQLGTQQSMPTRSTTTAQSKPDSASIASTQQPAAAALGAEPATSTTAKPQEAAAPRPAAVPAATPQPTASAPVTSQPIAPEPAALPKPSATPSAVADASGPWFVNFGTYATRDMAETWANRLRPVAGEVIIAPNDKDGRTLYRVRVVRLSDRDSAQQVARNLEADLRVSELWVGRE